MQIVKKPFWEDPNSLWAVQRLFGDARVFLCKEEVLRFACGQAPAQGLFLELGVARGETIRFLAGSFPEKTFYGFDSFAGLPEDWIRRDGRVRKGAFQQDALPEVPPNVRLVPGLFRETLLGFAKRPIAFIHIDCDLYSSTRDALEALGSHIGVGTVLAFDEFYNYPGFEEHEFKAFGEFLEKKALKATAIAYNAFHEQAAFTILSDPSICG